jgi:hypothetical protein
MGNINTPERAPREARVQALLDEYRQMLGLDFIAKTQLTTTAESIQGHLKTVVFSDPAMSDVPERAQARIMKALSEMFEKVATEVLNIEELVQLSLDVVAESYTVEELEHLLDFYKTPIGSRIAGKLGPMVAETASRSLLYNEEVVGPRLQVAMPTLVEQLEERVEAILQEEKTHQGVSTIAKPPEWLEAVLAAADEAEAGEEENNSRQ